MKTLILTIALTAALWAQPNQLDLRQDPPTAVQSNRVSSAYTGASGATTYYYWVVTRYPIGFIVPTAPVIVGGASALGGGNSVALAWPAMTGASSYDVLRTTTNAAPSSCTCAVVLATTGTTLTDNGGALSAWPPGGLNSAGVAQAELQINNRDAGAPYITLAVRNAQRILNYQLGILKNGTAPSYVPSGFIQPYSNNGVFACVDSTGADCLGGLNDFVIGRSALTTANRVPIVASAGTLGQSDLSLASGIFSRAGTLGLSATGANVLTFSTNGSERARITSGGIIQLATMSITDIGSQVLRFGNTGSGGSSSYQFFDGTNNNVLAVLNAAATQYVELNSNGPSKFMGGNLLIGTTTDDGASTLQVAGLTTISGAAGGVKIKTRNTGSDWLWYVTSAGLQLFNETAVANFLYIDNTGLFNLYNQTATTGVTSFVVRAGAGQGSAYLTKVVDNANADKIFTQILSGQAVTTHYYDASNYSSWVQASGAMLFGTITDTAFTLIANNAEKIKLNNTGIGFFGVTPVARQTATADAASILALLQAYGLSN